MQAGLIPLNQKVARGLVNLLATFIYCAIVVSLLDK